MAADLHVVVSKSGKVIEVMHSNSDCNGGKAEITFESKDDVPEFLIELLKDQGIILPRY